MLPQNVLSSTAIESTFVFPRNVPREPFVDYEMGGVDIEDASAGLRVKVWRGDLIEDAIVLSAPSVAPATIITVANITEFGFTFDQAMRPFIAYALESGLAYFYWFDTTISDYTTTQLPSGTITPRCSLDDNRALQGSTSDIILAYVRAGSLYFRAQRDRYTVEYLLDAAVGNRGLIQIGMNLKNRFQFQMTTS